jgi:hypothetical protein
MLALWVVTAWAVPSAAELEAAWEAHRPALDAHAVYPLRWTSDEYERVAKGKVARRRERLDGADRVLGMVWVPADQDTTWVAVQDPHGPVTVDGMVHEELPGSTFQRRLLFQSIDLPWPLATRQWVIEVTNNLPLIAATQGRVWERTWKPSEARGAKAELPDAVWLPVNDGGWMFVEAGEGTLLVYHARTVIGGNIPDDLATRWSFGTLSGMLEGLRDRVPWVRSHYVTGHDPLQRPDGKAVAPLPVESPAVAP